MSATSIVIDLFDAVLTQETSKEGKSYVALHAKRSPFTYEKRLFFSRETTAGTCLGEATLKRLVAKPFPAGSTLKANCTIDASFELKIVSVQVVEEGPGEAKVFVVEKRVENAKPEAGAKGEAKGDGTYGVPADLS